jgi:hypothetical protein
MQNPSEEPEEPPTKTQALKQAIMAEIKRHMDEIERATELLLKIEREEEEIARKLRA